MAELWFDVCRSSFTRGEEEYAVVCWAKQHGLKFYCHPNFNSDGKEVLTFEVSEGGADAIFAWRTVCPHWQFGTAQNEFCKELVRQLGLDLPSPEEVQEKAVSNWHWEDDMP